MFICSAHLGLVTKHLLSLPVCMWGFHTAMTVKERCCLSLLKRSGEAARTSSHVRQGLFSKPELITRLLSGTRDGALSLSWLWLCNWRLWSQISRFEMWSTLPVCSPSSSISDRHEYTLLSTPTKFCSDKNPFSGQQRNALCTCFKSYLTCFFCISTAVKAGQTPMTFKKIVFSASYLMSGPKIQNISRHSLQVAFRPIKNTTPD